MSKLGDRCLKFLYNTGYGAATFGAVLTSLSECATQLYLRMYDPSLLAIAESLEKTVNMKYAIGTGIIGALTFKGVRVLHPQIMPKEDTLDDITRGVSIATGHIVMDTIYSLF